ncbi:zinc finger protein 236-like isoform X1 [Xenopus laevis]|uniref:Zinc finger protein 236-like isoform X1 n=1 Tax=Xenopus laevis TaxID=8355 RepID=A0A8J1L2E0_XENLA|nr:zinc finger protein 236-like isoform X1 [Xenopus laevis]
MIWVEGAAPELQKEESERMLACGVQVDPSLLQQTLQHTSIMPQQIPGDPNADQPSSSLQTSDNSMPANDVIQPIASLSLQPATSSPSSLTIRPMVEQESVLSPSSSLLESKWKQLCGGITSHNWIIICIVPFFLFSWPRSFSGDGFPMLGAFF